MRSDGFIAGGAPLQWRVFLGIAQSYDAPLEWRAPSNMIHSKGSHALGTREAPSHV